MHGAAALLFTSELHNDSAVFIAHTSKLAVSKHLCASNYYWTSLVKTLGMARNCQRSGQVWSYCQRNYLF
jgi:hypothetical protein